MKSFILLSLLFTQPLFANLGKIEQKDFLNNTGNHQYKVLVFLNKNCPCTNFNAEYLNELQKTYTNVDFIGVHSLKSASDEDVARYAKEKNFNFTVINDKDLKIADLVRANRTPQTIIINAKNSEIVYSGGLTNRTQPKEADQFYLKDSLEEIKLTNNLSPKSFRSLGCAIVR